MDADVVIPVDAIRTGPGQFLLAAERVTPGLVFVVDGTQFKVVGEPVNIGGDRYMATIWIETGKGAGRQLTAYLQVGHRVG